MPRRKKNGQSPARVPGGPQPEEGSPGHNTGYRPPQGFGGAMANNFPASTSLSSSGKETIVKSMQEMFSHLDPEVIYIVLSECDFKVENAMDSLLELSVAAEVAGPVPSPPVSGFERTAAALLSSRHFSEPRPDHDPSRSSQLPSSYSPPSTGLLTGELDLLVDQELETLTTKQAFKAECLSSSHYLSTFPPVPFPEQVLPELLHSSLHPGSIGPFVQQQGLVGGTVEQISGASSPLDQLSTWEDEGAEERLSIVDFSHLMTEMPKDKPTPPLDLAASGRPSAFQLYKKQEQSSHTRTDKAWVMPSKEIVGGTRSKVNTLNQGPFSYTPSWNPEAPAFAPRFHGNQGPAFITPVAQAPSNWPSLPRHASPWLSQSPVSQAPLKPFATIPKSWALPAAPQPPAQYDRLRLEGRVLVLLRGAPGSGKSTLARALVEHNPGGVKLSTDDYFTRGGAYHFEPTALGEAHDWNHKRAKEAFGRSANPIIIDNTNMQGWEMKPYVAQALKHGYKVLFREPDTWWKNKPRELERRSTHNVPAERIRRMLNGYERFVTVQSIMGSQMPEVKQRLILENKSSQLDSSETPCPDLVGQPGFSEGCKKSHPQLFSSLPDVSSIGRFGEMGMMGDGTQNSTESLDFQPTGTLTEHAEISDSDADMYLGELDSELDAQLEQNHPIGDQRIPDCIVESVMNEDNHGDEMPVAFSESIGQRVKRERPSRRSDFDRLQPPADLVKDTNQSDSKAKEKEKTNEEEADGVEMERDVGEKGIPKLTEFDGDWPSEGSLEQRQVRRRDGHKEEEGLSQEANRNQTKGQSGPRTQEFQKLLDLIQTGVAPIQTGSSRSSTLSQISGEESGTEGEAAGGGFEESRGSESNSEERKQNMSRLDASRGELPDCVLDWKAADSCNARESRIDHWEGLQTENETNSTTGGNDNNVSEIGRETASVDLKSTNPTKPPLPLSADLLVVSKCEEKNVCCDVVSHNLEGEVSAEPGAGHTDVDNDNCTENKVEADISHSEVCPSPLDGSLDLSSFSGGSQERKQRQGRRSGKQCKLALTFTQNYPTSSPNTPECPNINSSPNSINVDVEPSYNASCNTSLCPQTNFDPSTDSESETHLQPTSPLSLVDTGCPTQTEPHDFALLWRLNRQDCPEEAAVSASSNPSDVTVLSGDSGRFVPELSSAVSAAVAVNPSDQRVVPYRVGHEKGTQVEEKELGATQDRLESLRILSRHFKLVSFDMLEDLYDKCHQDLEWTTNLLLDSGERFFRDEHGEREEEEEDGTGGEKDQNPSSLCGALGMDVENRLLCSNVLDEHRPEDWPNRELIVFDERTNKSTSGPVSESDGISSTTDVRSEGHPDTTSQLEKSPQTELSLPHASNEGESCVETEHRGTSEADLEDSAWGGGFADGVIIEESRVEIEEEIASMDEVNRMLQAELDEMESEGRQKKEESTERRHMGERRSRPLNIQSVELKLPTELALQLTELFGPVGVDPGACSSDDYEVQMDLNLAKQLHQKWKETIQEKQRQASLSFHLFQESSVHWGDSQVAKSGSRDQTNFLISADSYGFLDSQPEAPGLMPLMDHWNVSRPQVSFRDIIKEEQALQENFEKTRQSRADLDRRDGSTLLKENQLFTLFPNIDRHFLLDIFRDHNYNLIQTERFLRTLLDEGPVKTVVAPEAPRSDHQRAASKDREKRQKALEVTVSNYQDTEDPEYQDFRAEASLQRNRQLESFSKAAEAFKQGQKEVASFYAQQGHLHGKRMREANHRAAVQIFERVNSSLLPSNILDLHGLHVDEALEHLAQVLEDKTKDYEQGLCRPQLSVITGRGNHSQGGVARIRPAVIDYLTNKNYRFTEPKPGLMLVSLK